MNTYSLLDLNAYIRRVMAVNFRDPVWITAEISACKNARGHYYIELVQKGETEVVAQSSAVLWMRQYQLLRFELGKALDEVLREGMELRLLVRVDFHERYGLKLVIESVDPAFTFGKIELHRRETIEALQKEGLLARNKKIPLPLAIQRIAVLSSEDAAGWQDFRTHLGENPFAYHFDLHLFQCALQGPRVALELPLAMAKIALQAEQFDAVVIIRGGGARLDLAAFDEAEVARAIAQCPIPVFTGIGHDVDETVSDLVAHSALKTPTAVADFLIQHLLVFENSILNLGEQLRSLGQYTLQNSLMEVERAEYSLRLSAGRMVDAQKAQLDQIARALPLYARQIIKNAVQKIELAERVCVTADPQSILRRGFSMTLLGGKPVLSSSQLKPGDVLETRFFEGKSSSKVEKTDD